MFTAPFPFWHHFSLPPDTPTSELTSLCLNQLELLLLQQTAPKDTAAIIIEPVIGEGGYVPAPPEFMQGLREICDRENILLIIDEVQSGFLRTGKNFAIEYSGVRPDIMLVAKVRVSSTQRLMASTRAYMCCDCRDWRTDFPCRELLREASCQTN